MIEKEWMHVSKRDLQGGREDHEAAEQDKQPQWARGGRERNHHPTSKYTGGRERNHHPTSREDQATAASIQVGASAITIQQAEHEAEDRGTAASIQVGASAITIQQAEKIKQQQQVYRWARAQSPSNKQSMRQKIEGQQQVYRWARAQSPSNKQRRSSNSSKYTGGRERNHHPTSSAWSRRSSDSVEQVFRWARALSPSNKQSMKQQGHGNKQGLGNKTSLMTDSFQWIKKKKKKKKKNSYLCLPAPSFTESLNLCFFPIHQTKEWKKSWR